MTPAVALIRGINVGGKNTLPMASLRGICEGLGLRNAATYIQSGNVVFMGSATAVATASRKIAAGIEKAHGFRPSVVVRTLEETQAALAACPFAGNPARVLVMFLEGEPVHGAAKAVAALCTGPERIVVARGEAYLHFPKGVGASRLSMAKVEAALGTPGTSRNVRTVAKAVEMMEAISAS
ncbi:MAG: DUF1697 domain-containing protein [Phycisphaerales bacterium]